MTKIRLARKILTALTAAALVGVPAPLTVCDMTTHDVAPVAEEHHHQAPPGAAVADGGTCVECNDMTGCCLVPAGALSAAGPLIPSAPAELHDDVIAREHLANTLIRPHTPPPRA